MALSYTWWKEPYQNRAGYKTGVTITKVVDLDDPIADDLVLSVVRS